MPYFFRKLGKILQTVPSAAVVIGALRISVGSDSSNVLKCILPIPNFPKGCNILQYHNHIMSH